MDDNSSSSEDNKKDHSKKSSSINNGKNGNNSNLEEQEELKNYYEYINESLSNNEENRQNYYNTLEELKLKINEIKSNKLKSIDYILIILDDFIKLSDEFYKTFETTKEIITKFNDLNDEAQNILFSYQKKNYSISYFKETNQKLLKEIEKKEKENDKLRNRIKEMNKIDIEKENIINSINEKNNEKNENNKNKEIKVKMDNLLEENKELKRKYSQVMTESQLFKDYVDQKYILKQESTKRMSCLIDKINSYENKIDNLQNKIIEIEKEKEEEKEKENNEKIIEKENIINLENPKSYLSDNNSLNQVGFNLEELLDNDDNEDEEEEKNINIINVEENKSGKSPKIQKYNEYDIDVERDKKAQNILSLCPINQFEYKKLNHVKNVKSNFSILSSPKSSIVDKTKKHGRTKSLYTMKNKENKKNSYKIFFFLLLKSIFINCDICEYFKKEDYESLYKECQNEKISFNKYQEWILNKFNLKENNIHIDSSIIDCFITSSLI